MSVERDIVHHGASDDDLDAEETREWLDALLSVIRTDGLERAHYLIERRVR